MAKPEVCHDDSEMHVGKDGVSLKGRDAIACGILLLFAACVVAMLYYRLEKDEVRATAISEIKEQVGLMQRDHEAFAGAVGSLTDVMKEQNCILLATEKEAERLRRASQWSTTACRKMMEAAR